MDCYITSDNVCNPTLIEVTHQQKISDLLSLLQRQNLFYMIASKFHFFGEKLMKYSTTCQFSLSGNNLL